MKNTARDVFDMLAGEDGWTTEWKQDKVIDSVTSLLHFLEMHMPIAKWPNKVCLPLLGNWCRLQIGCIHTK